MTTPTDPKARVVEIFGELGVLLNRSGSTMLEDRQFLADRLDSAGLLALTWTAVTEALPNKGGAYLVYAPSLDSGKPFFSMAWFDPSNPGWQMIPKAWGVAVSHWQRPIPPRKPS